MANIRVNPSRNAEDNQIRSTYGYVIKVKRLPEPHARIVDFIVYNEEDDCFYRCIKVDNATQLYYTWQAVTFGASRAYLVPVGKLTEKDRGNDPDDLTVTEKDVVECMAKTYNELVFGLRRYKVVYDPVGYARPTEKVYTSTGTYYAWVWNKWDWRTIIEDHKVNLTKFFTGEMTLLVKGVDYNVGDDIVDGEVYVEGSPAFSALTRQDLVAPINKIVQLLNSHKADIPEANASMTHFQISAIVNLIIEEVNPFSAAWQLLLNRMHLIEQEIGFNPEFQELTEDQENADIDFTKWVEKEWRLFYDYTADAAAVADKKYYTLVKPAGGAEKQYYVEASLPVGTAIAPNTYYEKYTIKQMFGADDALLYGNIITVCDTTLKLLEYMDARTGSIGGIKNIGSMTLVDWLNNLYQIVINLQEKVRINTEGIRQLRLALGQVGYVLTPDTTFQLSPVSPYYVWMDDEYWFKPLVAGTDYTPGDSIAAYSKPVYQFIDGKTAENLINKNANEIVRNRAEVDELLGTELKIIYLETFEKYALASRTYYKFNPTAGSYTCTKVVTADEKFQAGKFYYYKDADDKFQRMVLNPKYPADQKGYKIGDTIASVGYDVYVQTENNPKFIELEVEEGDDLDELRLTVGPILITSTANQAVEQIRENNEQIQRLNADFFVKYNQLKNRIANLEAQVNRLRELTGVRADIEEWNVDGYKQLTSGTFQEYIKYYTFKSADPEHPLPTDPEADTKHMYVDLTAGTYEEYLLGGCDYVLPYYSSTTDTYFKAGKDYYKYNSLTGKYTKCVKGTKEQYDYDTSHKNYDYYEPCYRSTEDERYQANKTYYSYDGTTYTPISGYVVGDTIPDKSKVFEYHTLAITAGYVFEYNNPTPITADFEPRDSECSGVWIRKAHKEDGGYEELNTHRGMIDRNYVWLDRCRENCGEFQKWTKRQLKAIEDFVISLLMSSLDVITQERSTLSLLHETVGKLISLHNALERLEGEQTWKKADGVYDSGYTYYRKFGEDDYRQMIEGSEEEGIGYEVGLEVGSNVYTKDLVIATTENYTINEIRMAVNRVIRYHIETEEIPEYTELPDDTIILSTMIYYYYDDDEWVKVDPDTDDPSMIGQRVKDYDPYHKWFIKTREEVPDGKSDPRYTETPCRILLNELIKLHRRSNSSLAVSTSLMNNMVASLMTGDSDPKFFA